MKYGNGHSVFIHVSDALSSSQKGEAMAEAVAADEEEEEEEAAIVVTGATT